MCMLSPCIAQGIVHDVLGFIRHHELLPGIKQIWRHISFVSSEWNNIHFCTKLFKIPEENTIYKMGRTRLFEHVFGICKTFKELLKS